jgi:hypothetical protein
LVIDVWIQGDSHGDGILGAWTCVGIRAQQLAIGAAPRDGHGPVYSDPETLNLKP